MIRIAFFFFFGLAASTQTSQSDEETSTGIWMCGVGLTEETYDVVDVALDADAFQSNSRSGFRFVAATSSDECATNCMNLYKASVGSVGDRVSSADEQRNYCRVINRTLDCYQACSNTERRANNMRMFEVPKYICLESRVLEFAACFSRVSTAMEPICRSPTKCGMKKTIYERARNLRPSEQKNIDDRFKAYCDFQQCDYDCQSDQVVEECGEDGKKVFYSLLVKVVNYLQNLYSQIGFNAAMPNECKKIITEHSDDE